MTKNEKNLLDIQAKRKAAKPGELERRADGKSIMSAADELDLSRLSVLGRIGKLR